MFSISSPVRGSGDALYEARLRVEYLDERRTDHALREDHEATARPLRRPKTDRLDPSDVDNGPTEEVRGRVPRARRCRHGLSSSACNLHSRIRPRLGRPNGEHAP